LLWGPSGLAIRLARPVVVAWAVAIAVGALLMGLIAKSAGSVLSSSSSAARVFSRLGARGGGADAYLAVAFLMVAVLVTLVAAGQVATARNDEAEGRLDHLLVRPVARGRWFAGRLALGVTVVVALGIAAGAFAWVGAASQHAGVRIGDAFAAGVNTLPPAVVVLGVGLLALGAWPSGTAVASYGVLAWSFLVDVVGGIVNANHWLLDTSVFHQMAAAPAVSPDWTSAGALSALGAGMAVVGGLVFTRRDLVGA
jgi:ABC-2 type transport system permease protein